MIIIIIIAVDNLRKKVSYISPVCAILILLVLTKSILIFVFNYQVFHTVYRKVWPKTAFVWTKIEAR